jgi:hypothetical protein
VEVAFRIAKATGEPVMTVPIPSPATASMATKPTTRPTTVGKVRRKPTFAELAKTMAFPGPGVIDVTIAKIAKAVSVSIDILGWHPTTDERMGRLAMTVQYVRKRKSEAVILL